MISPSRRPTLFACLALVLLTFAAYWPALHAGFIWDDDQYVTHVRFQRTFGDLWRIWTDTQFTPQYYPLIHTSYWIEYHLWKFEPLGYHAVNILFHASAACLVALAMVRLGWARWPAWAAGTLFALHPLNVESVAWVTERKNVMCGFFYALTFHVLLSLYRIREREEGESEGVAETPWSLRGPGRERFPWGIYVLTFVLFFFTLTSKTVGSVLPAVFALVLWWKGRRLNVRMLLPLAPMFLLGAGMGRVTSYLETTRVGANGQDWDISLLDRVLIAGRVVWFYFGKWFWPEPLQFMYPRWKVDHTEAWQYAFPIGAAAVLVGLWLLRKKLGRGPLVATLIYLGCLLPASGFFNIYPQRFSFVADHFAYLATMALAVLVAGVGWWCLGGLLVGVKSDPLNRKRVWGFVVGAVVVLGVCAVVTNFRARDYESGETIWADTYRKDPNGMLTLISMSHIRESKKDDAGALELLLKAAEIHKHPMVYQTLGIYYEKHGKRAEAVEAYRAAVAAFRDFEPERGVAHKALGRLYDEAGDRAAAAEQLILALQCRPMDVESAFNLGVMFQGDGQFLRAAGLFEQVVDLQPTNADAWLKLAACYYQMGRFADAATACDRVLAFAPDHAGAHGSLATYLTAMHSPSAALAHFEFALRAMPGDLALMRNYALALATSGHRQQAAEMAEKAAAIAQEKGNAPLAADLRARAQQYRAGP